MEYRLYRIDPDQSHGEPVELLSTWAHPEAALSAQIAAANSAARDKHFRGCQVVRRSVSWGADRLLCTPDGRIPMEFRIVPMLKECREEVAS